MSDNELQSLLREYYANPTDELLLQIRRAKTRAGIALDPINRKLYLEYNETREGGEPEDPTSRWTYHTAEYINFTPIALKLSRSKDTWRNEIINVNFIPYAGQKVTLVVVRYRTGSTFGVSYGRWQIIGIFEEQNKADEACKLISDYENIKLDRSAFHEGIEKLTNNRFYDDWTGYFEEYMDTEITTHTISND